MRKKFSDNPARTEKKTSAIPYKKPEQKRKNPLAEVAKKYFEKNPPDLKKPDGKKKFAPGNNKPGKNFSPKKFHSPKISKEEEEEVKMI